MHSGMLREFFFFFFFWRGGVDAGDRQHTYTASRDGVFAQEAFNAACHRATCLHLVNLHRPERNRYNSNNSIAIIVLTEQKE